MDTIIPIIESSCEARPSLIETYVVYIVCHFDLLSKYEKRKEKKVLVKYYHKVFRIFVSFNFASFVLHLLKRGIIDELDVKGINHEFFLNENPEYANDPLYRWNFLTMDYPENIEDPFEEIDRRRSLSITNDPFAVAICADDDIELQKLVSQNIGINFEIDTSIYANVLTH